MLAVQLVTASYVHAFVLAPVSGHLRRDKSQHWAAVDAKILYTLFNVIKIIKIFDKQIFNVNII
jgi:hypothetical protein